MPSADLEALPSVFYRSSSQVEGDRRFWFSLPPVTVIIRRRFHLPSSLSREIIFYLDPDDDANVLVFYVPEKIFRTVLEETRTTMPQEDSVVWLEGDTAINSAFTRAERRDFETRVRNPRYMLGILLPR